MREHPPVDIVIHDNVMDGLAQLPPQALDDFAAAMKQLREHPETVPSRPVFPHPVDHSRPRPDTPVPATRSASYLRNAVAEISPPTVANFDQEFREDTTAPTPQERLQGLRQFLYRWIEYIAIQGTRADALYLAEAANDARLLAERYVELSTRIRRDHFPDAADNPADLSIRVRARGASYVAVCPITMFRTTRPTPQAAHEALQALIYNVLMGY